MFSLDCDQANVTYVINEEELNIGDISDEGIDKAKLKQGYLETQAEDKFQQENFAFRLLANVENAVYFGQS